MIRPQAVTNVLEYSFGKWTKQIKCMTQKSSRVSFLGKSSLKKLSIKIYGQNPCKTVVKNIIFPFLNTWNSIAFIQKCKYCPHCRNNGLLLIKMKKNRSLFNNNKVSICLLLFFKWISFMIGSIFRIFLATVPPSPRQISVMSWRYYIKKICK